MAVYGITGSIAVGKSTVTNYLLGKGYTVIDSDKLAHEAMHDETCKQQINDLFPSAMQNNIVDRKILGAILFHDKVAKKQIENIIHPYVIKHLQQAINQNKSTLFLDIPLLYEANLEYLCDQIIVVYTTPSLQLTRLMKRDNSSREEALKRIHNQIDIEEKRKKADIVLDNNGSQEELYQQIEKMIGEYIENINDK